jgi:hypothetical protein
MMPGCLCDLVERYVLMTLDQVIKPARYGCRMSTQWIIGWSLLAKDGVPEDNSTRCACRRTLSMVASAGRHALF